MTRQHWEDIYTAKKPTEVSWYQHQPSMSLDLISALGVPKGAGVVDVGGGASPLAGALLSAGYRDLTVVDVSAAALHAARSTLDGAEVVSWLRQDLLEWEPTRRFDVWHDRAVFHFLTDPIDRERYLQVLDAALSPAGAVVLGTFATDGPDSCSGLPVARYDPGDLAHALGPTFTVVDAAREEHRTPWGAVQSFSWVVARRSEAGAPESGPEVPSAVTP